MTIIHADGLPDDRVICGTCTHLKSNNYCAAFRMATWSSLPVRCLRYVPTTRDPDPRTGRERWPDLERTIAETREIDRKYREEQAA